MKSIYNVNSFFLHIHLKNEYIKKKSLFFVLNWNAFNFPHHLIVAFTDLLVDKGVVLLMSYNSKSRLGRLSLVYVIPCLGFGI